MKQGCKYCQFNKYDGIHLGSNICSVDTTHIDPYAEGYCADFKARPDKFEDLIVFDDQPKRQLKSPKIHND